MVALNGKIANICEIPCVKIGLKSFEKQQALV